MVARLTKTTARLINRCSPPCWTFKPPLSGHRFSLRQGVQPIGAVCYARTVTDADNDRKEETKGSSRLGKFSAIFGFVGIVGSVMLWYGGCVGDFGDRMVVTLSFATVTGFLALVGISSKREKDSLWGFVGVIMGAFLLLVAAVVMLLFLLVWRVSGGA